MQRVQDIAPACVKQAKLRLDFIAQAWEDMAIELEENLYYSGNTPHKLLITEAEDSEFSFPPSLNSMRNVEESLGVYINSQ